MWVTHIGRLCVVGLLYHKSNRLTQSLREPVQMIVKNQIQLFAIACCSVNYVYN